MYVSFSSSAASQSSTAVGSSPQRQPVAASSTADAAATSFSQALLDASSASSSSTNKDQSVEARLAEIRAKGPVNRSQEDHDFLFANDKNLAEISAKAQSPENLTADELHYMQKATGMVDTFSYLSSSEKALYDKALASGNSGAAEAIALIALTRVGGGMAGGSNGTTYNPRNTEITAANVDKYFRHSVVDSSENSSAAKFEALIRFLQNMPVA